MKYITKLMINDFKLKKLRYDFTGYHFNKTDDLSYHHTIIPKCVAEKSGMGELYTYWNGSILCADTSHPYIHLIAQKDYDMFAAITSELIDENIKGHLDRDNIIRIHDIMQCFEREHCSDRDKKGKLLIKDKYIEDRIDFTKII